MLVVGTDQSETLNGSSGDDEITGRRGDDVVNALAGNDMIFWSTGTSAATSDGGDFTDGGDGIDRFLVMGAYTLLTSDSASWTHTFRLEAGAAGLASLTMTSTGQRGFPTYDVIGSSVTLGMRNVETFSFHGVYGPAQTQGPPGSTLGSAESFVVGDLRSTDLTGLLLFDLGAGNDTLDASASYNQIAALGGDGNDVLTGGAGNDELVGGAGNDRLKANGGSNTLIGGLGDDLYDSDNRFDSVNELAGEGTDSLSTRASLYILQNQVENLTFIGTGDFVGIGNAQNNIIDGGAGNDYLVGFDGNDTLYGRGGLNTLQGGLGDDSYYAETTSDTIYELAGEGVDTLYIKSQVYTLVANVENLREGIAMAGVTWTGNELDNLIVGSAVSDVLYGLAGNDTLDAGFGGNNGHNVLRGGTGDDTYRIQTAGDEVIELAGEGTDTVVVKYIDTYVLPSEVENLLVTINANTDMRGNGANNVMTGGAGRDKLAGLDGNDQLNGGANHDFLSGDAGNDVLNGGTGADEISGGTGADRFVFEDVVQDLVHDFSRAEGDKVDVNALLAGVGYTGGANAFADGYLRIVPVESLPPSGIPVTRLQFDPDGSAGAQGFGDVAIFLGGTEVIAPQDFVFG
jgi:Ca2+-binding RTX toxin-like protein